MAKPWKKEIVEVARGQTPVTRTTASAHAVKVGPLLFVTGQSGRQPGGPDNYADDPAEQTRQTLENIRAILEAGGSSFDQVIKRTVIVGHPSMMNKVRPVLEEYFRSPCASTSLQGALLREEKMVEIDVIALIPDWTGD